MRSGRRSPSFLLALIPPLWIAVLVSAWGVDLPHWDQWELVPRLEALATGDFDPMGLWQPHNEHRLLFPRLLMVGMAAVSGWNIHWELWANLALAVALAAVLLLLLRRTAPGPVPPAALALGSLVVFNPSQWMNWSWGWQSQIFLVVLGVAAAVTWLTADRPGGLPAAATAAAVATGSFANGLLAWPLGLPLAALPLAALPLAAPRSSNPTPGPRWRRGALWLLLGACAWALYFHGFRPSPDVAVDRGLLGTLQHFGAYVSIYLGAPLFGFHGRLCLWAGFLAVAAAFALAALWLRDAHREGRWRYALPWCVLMAWALGSAAVTAAGRLHLGIGQALSSRYVTLSELFWLGLLGLWVTRGASDAQRRIRTQARLALLLAAAVLVVNGAHGVARWDDSRRERAALQQALRATATATEVEALDLTPIYPQPE
ncbi:MAG: hypothetical protein AAGD06_20470, partial [Acidobacteriota bacterium]